MAQATVKTVQFVDPRIEPQPDPVYDYVIGPVQNQYYKIPCSGKSNTSLTFNNLNTLGIDRAYLDTFELELDCTIRFHLETSEENTDGVDEYSIIPAPDEWTFQSFPFNTCCDEARVNINGGAFFSQPLCYVRAKERYMDQWALSNCYENVCPCHRPVCQTETGRTYNYPYDVNQSSSYNTPIYESAPNTHSQSGRAVPTRLGVGMFNFNQSECGMSGGFNNSIVRLGKYDEANNRYENMYRDGDDLVVRVKWREPLFVSPFSSRYDATYGRPLYNITSMDFAFTMTGGLQNMIRVANLYHPEQPSVDEYGTWVKNYDINIESAMLCYQVMTIPTTIQKPLTTLVPYRRFVPYITEFNQAASGGGSGSVTPVRIAKEGADLKIRSGVYTLNEIPTAIWVFCAPTKNIYQTNLEDKYETGDDNEDNCLAHGNYESNNLFGFLRHINITLANTTQILNTAEPLDLYRIAKANGCQDSYLAWGVNDCCLPKAIYNPESAEGETYSCPLRMYYGPGSVLRLKPGVDIIVPDIPLIPGANGNNMVLQVEADFWVPPHSANKSTYALWLLFEYVGVAAISPGQCEITMNPLGSGEIMAASPVMSATSESTEGTLEGQGFWDKAKKSARIAGQIADEGILSRILKHIPGGKDAADWAARHGLGEPGCKRPRGGAGGAVIGHGLSDWV